MLSDEENKAIKIAKSITEDDLLNYWEGSEEPYNAIQTILNLIEKQQKEIERLEARKYILNAETGEISQIPIDNNYISKDKIKAKIEEYDDKGMTVNLANRSAGKTFQQAVHYEIKKVLQTLLEKE